MKVIPRPVRARLVRRIEWAQGWLRNRDSYGRGGWAARGHYAGAWTLMRLEYGKNTARAWGRDQKRRRDRVARYRRQIADAGIDWGVPISDARRPAPPQRRDRGALAADQARICADRRRAIRKLLDGKEDDRRHTDEP